MRNNQKRYKAHSYAFKKIQETYQDPVSQLIVKFIIGRFYAEFSKEFKIDQGIIRDNNLDQYPIYRRFIFDRSLNDLKKVLYKGTSLKNLTLFNYHILYSKNIG